MTELRRAIKARHWTVALGGALAIHAGVALFLGQPQSSGAVAVGLGGVAVDLGTAGGAPGEVEAAAVAEAASEAIRVPEADMAAPVETAEAVPANPAPPVEAAPPVETAAAVAAAEVPLYAPEVPDEVPVEAVPVEAVPVEPVRATPAMATPAPPPRKPAVPQPEVAAAPPAEPAPVRETDPAPQAAAVADSAAPARGPQFGKLTPDELAGSGGKAGKGDTAASGMEDGRNAGGVPGQSADYKALLMAWLEKHKEYPRRAKLRRQEGTAYLSFVIDRDGRLLEYRLDKSSGYKLLDAEVTAMIERAAPLPPVPGDPSDDRFTYTVPINFNLR
ncbi:MAG: hypothetical protein Kow00114_09160 [Kiloniellaceae bacterium]